MNTDLFRQLMPPFRSRRALLRRRGRHRHQQPGSGKSASGQGAFPWLDGSTESHWARVATPMAGKKRGLYFLPEVDDEVLVAFEHGSIDFPCVIGSLWNGKDTPPESNSDRQNNNRALQFAQRSHHPVRRQERQREHRDHRQDRVEQDRRQQQGQHDHDLQPVGHRRSSRPPES